VYWRNQAFSTNKLERRTLDGREYAVAPAVAIVEGVLNGYFVPADEIAGFVEAWNGRPIPLRHPQRNGEYVSANSPDIVEAEVIGAFYNAYMDGTALKGEFWFDVAKIERLGGIALDTLNRMEAGEVVEVSTAYWCEIVVEPGIYNATPYLGVQRGIRPDHIALLPDEIGACSVSAGCGVPRLNAASERLLAMRTAVALANNAVKGEKMEIEEEVNSTSPAEPLEEVTANGGEEVTEAPDAPAETSIILDDTLASVVIPAPPVEVPGVVTQADVLLVLVEMRDQISEQAARIEAQAAQIDDLLQCKAQMAEGLEVNASAVRKYTDQFAVMVTDVASGLQALAERYNASDLEVSEVMGALKVLGGVEWLTSVGATVTALNEFGGVSAISSLQERFNNLSAVLTNWTYDDMYMMYEFMDFVKQSGGVQEVANVLTGVQVNTRRTKATIIRSLTGNKACAFGKDELEAMTLDMLEKLERSLAPNSYAGRGGERSNGASEGDGWEPYTPPARWNR